MRIKDAWELLGIAPTSNVSSVTSAFSLRHFEFVRQNDTERIKDLDKAKELLLEVLPETNQFSVNPAALAPDEDGENRWEEPIDNQEPPAVESDDTSEQVPDSQGPDDTEQAVSSTDIGAEAEESDNDEDGPPEPPSLGKVLNDFLEDGTYFADASRWQALFEIADNESPAIRDAFVSALKGWLPNAATVLDEASWQVIAAWMIKAGATKVFFACDKARKELPPMDFSIYTRLPKKIRLNWFELRNRVYLDLNVGKLENVSESLAFLKTYNAKDPTVIELNACYQAVNAQVHYVPQATVETAVQAVPIGTPVGDFLRKYVDAVYFDSYQWPGTIPPERIKGSSDLVSSDRPIEIPEQVYYVCQAAMSGSTTIKTAWEGLVVPALQRKMPKKEEKEPEYDPYKESAGGCGSFIVAVIIMMLFTGISFMFSKSYNSYHTAPADYSSVELADPSMKQSLAEELVGREDNGALLLLNFYWRDHPKVEGTDNYKAHFTENALAQIKQAKVDSFPKLDFEATEAVYRGEGTDEVYGKYIIYQSSQIDKVLFVITLNEEGQGTAIYGEGWRAISEDDQERLLEYVD